jgi:hypothetical protein
MAVHREHEYDHIFRVRFAIKGGHVHCRLFSSRNLRSPAWAKCGDFCVTKGREFRDLDYAFRAEMVGETDADTVAKASDIWAETEE